MVTKVSNLILATLALPKALCRLRHAKEKANFLYRAIPTRYYVLASSPTHLIVTSKEHQKKIGKRPIHTNQGTLQTRVATGEDMQRDCYYYTPTKFGKTPKKYKKILRQKLWQYIRHHYSYYTK